jgi:hypothetical protein
MSISRKSQGNFIFGEELNSVPLSGSPNPPINPSPSQTAGDAFAPFPFDVFKPH